MLLKLIYWLRKKYYILLGMKVGESTYLPKMYSNWPHKVQFGSNCVLEHNIFLKFVGVWSKGIAIFIGDNVFIGSGCEFNISKKIQIGNNTLIASGCKFIDHNHGIESIELIRLQKSSAKEIHIGNDVWLGCNVIVLSGISIGDGSIIGAGSVITKSISRNEIWAGVPARKIGERL